MFLTVTLAGRVRQIGTRNVHLVKLRREPQLHRVFGIWRKRNGTKGLLDCSFSWFPGKEAMLLFLCFRNLPNLSL
jgi:hypothetical protein